MKRPYVIAGSIVAVVMGVVGFLPLFGGPGYEHAIATGLVVPSAAAIAGPIGGVALSVYRFYTSPMIFAFDPFVGYFSGTLYDTLIEPGNALLTYRLGSLATLVALALLASCTYRTVGGGLGLTLGDART